MSNYHTSMQHSAHWNGNEGRQSGGKWIKILPIVLETAAKIIKIYSDSGNSTGGHHHIGQSHIKRLP